MERKRAIWHHGIAIKKATPNNLNGNLASNAVTLRFSGTSGTIAQNFPAGVMTRYCSVCGLEASKDARSCAGCGQGL